jgi:hypothetical protein
MASRSKWQLNDETDSIESLKFRSKLQKDKIDSVESTNFRSKSQKLMVQIDSFEHMKC